MTDVRRLLESERETQRRFVADARANETKPTGWPAALVIFHNDQWRGRVLEGLIDVRDGRPQTKPPENMDEFNDKELAEGAGVSLEEAAKRADATLVSIIDIYQELGERPFTWYRWSTTTEAVLVSSHIHPHVHIVEYLKENGDLDGAVRLLERTASELRRGLAPPFILGIELYNLARLRVAERRHDDALSLLEEAVAMRPTLKDSALHDPDLAPLRGLERFKAINGA